jgi:hypothetical protein
VGRPVLVVLRLGHAVQAGRAMQRVPGDRLGSGYGSGSQPPSRTSGGDMSVHQQQPPAPYVPEGYELKKKKPIYKRIWFWIAVIVIVGTIAAVAGGGGG